VICSACSDILSAALQVRDFEAIGQLPVVTEAEQASAIRAVSQRINRFGQASTQGSAQETDTSTTAKTIELFFGAAAAAGVAALVSPSFTSPASPPEAGALEKDDAAVRNPSAYDSVLAKGPDQMDIRQEFHDMHTIHDGGSMQSSISDYFGTTSGAGREAPNHFGQTGDPGEFSMDVKQAYSDTCAVRCQELVMRDFGLPVTQGGLVKEAMANGWYVPGGGTPESDMGKLLEAHGISVHHYDNGNIFTLVNELAQGHRVIISVDSGELWNTNEILKPIAEMNRETWEDWRPDHAVIVSGVDVSDPANPVVVVTDPGTGEVAARYALPDFMAAWEDSGFDMVATNTAPERFTMDHIPMIGEMPYEDFSRLLPSVEGLTRHEPGFTSLCSDFLRLVHESRVNFHETLHGFMAGHGHELQTPDDHGHFHPGLDGRFHDTDVGTSDSDSHHGHDL
jgi:hypothetical protein